MNVEALIFQQIVDANFDQSISTASPNGTINVVQIAAKGSGTNIGLALTPKGTGYISAQVPTGSTAGGNARGENSVDLQTFSRTASTQVASGAASTIGGGLRNTASNNSATVSGGNLNVASGAQAAVPGGTGNTASGANSFAAGSTSTASGNQSIALGDACSSTQTGSSAVGYRCSSTANFGFAFGADGLSHVRCMEAHGGRWFAAQGDNQAIALIASAKTTTNAEVELLADGTRWILRSGTVWSGILQIQGVKSDGAAVADYFRQVTIKRVGNTTSLVGSVITLGTDEAAGTSISVTADDTNESLRVAATGVTSETWRWQAIFRGGEMAYGT
jgi:hypothetical protein